MKTNSLPFSIKILLFSCTILFLAKKNQAQNWRTISLTDTNYFYYVSPLNSYDTVWDSYLRSVYKQSLNTLGNIESLDLPYSIRNDKFGTLDTITGHSWLGKQNIRNVLNGDEYYFNVMDDTILLKTFAGLNDTWTISKDTIGNYYIAQITSIDTLTIDGQIDSIKTISIQAYFGNNPVLNFYNGMQIILSKNHGFYKPLELYIFPNYDSLNVSNFLPNIYPILGYSHHRLDSTDINTDYTKVDLTWKYAPGNEWMIESSSGFSSNPYGYGLQHDSVISVNLISPDTIIVEFYRHSFNQYMLQTIPPSDTQYHVYSNIIDTFTSLNNQKTIRRRKFELPLNEYLIYSNDFNFDYSFVSWDCDNNIAVRDSAEFHSILSGFQIKSNKKSSRFGEKSMYNYSDGGTNGFLMRYNTFYSKIDSCSEGTKLNFKSLSIQDIETAASLITLYPNPSSNQIQIANLSNLNIISCSIKDITGKLISKQSNSKSIDISLLPNGLYFVEIHTEKGLLTKKIIKN